ncbi:hypothetical protein BDM02DRAFT_3182068 [Thelephora ganbajun]|uniref:Uncharacterized protein n=1 Tax=Thelephora ganbajun TaxID=370292 RepID=A0ACB6ZX82_THEGA|nr:hypothetical protein BDM02DRAFT_3182068 [Thelephora ganbajun]
MWDKDNLSLAYAGVIEKRHLRSAIIMSTRRDAPRRARREAPVAAGPLRSSHKTALQKIWDKRPCLPSVVSRKAWAFARGIDPTYVNRWFYGRVQKARESNFELDAESGGYDLDVEDGSLVGRLTPAKPPLGQVPTLYSATPEGLPELSCYEHSTSSDTGLRIPLDPGQPSSPIFGSSFYSPELTLDSPSGAYGHLPGLERFLFTPPSPPKPNSTTQPRSHSHHLAEEAWVRIHRSTSPASPTPNNRMPPPPLAPKKPRPSRGSHDVLNSRMKDDPCIWFSPPTPSPTPMLPGYSVPYRFGPRVQERDDKPNLSTFSDLRMIVQKTSRLIGQKRGGCIGDHRSLSHRDNQTAIPFHKFL